MFVGCVAFIRSVLLFGCWVDKERLERLTGFLSIAFEEHEEVLMHSHELPER